MKANEMENKLTNEKNISSALKPLKGGSSYSLQKLKTCNGQMTADNKRSSVWKNDISLNSTEIKSKEHYNRTWPHLKEKYKGSNNVGTISGTSIAVTIETTPNQESIIYGNNIGVSNDANSIGTLTFDSDEVNHRLKTDKSIDCKEKTRDWKEIRQIKKNAIKAEKQRLKEEEARKKFYEPKDQRVKIVDQNFFSLISTDVKTNQQSLFLFNTVNFPTLKPTKVVHNEQEHNNAADTAMASCIQTSSFEEVNGCNKMYNPNISQGINLSNIPRKVKKQPKRKDPIQFDISQAIKASGKVNKSKKSELKFKRQLNIISGNDLDSANPQRSRGKKREVPRRRKLTKLKLAIIQEREMKKNLRTLFQEKSTFVSNQTSDSNETIKIVDELVYDRRDVLSPSVSVNITNNKQLSEANNAINNPMKVFLGCLSTTVGNDLNICKGENFTNMSMQKFAKEIVPRIESVGESTSDHKETDLSESSILINTENSQNFIGCTSDLNMKKVAGPSISLNLHSPCAILNKKEVDSTNNEFDNRQQCQTEGMMKRNMAVKNSIHSRKFREYCNHSITEEINASVTSLLKDILKFHDRLYEKDPIKANAKRRHITGLREAKKYLGLKKLKLLIIAPDLENVSGRDGINEAIKYLMETAEAQNVPCIFALSRKILGKLTFKKVPVSCVGVINYEGSESNFHSLIQAVPSARELYNDAIKKAAESLGFQNVELKAIDSSEEDSNIKQEVISSLIAKLRETNLDSKNEQCQVITTIENNEDTE